jgi:hypothetical protein
MTSPVDAGQTGMAVLNDLRDAEVVKRPSAATKTTEQLAFAGARLSSDDESVSVPASPIKSVHFLLEPLPCFDTFG